MCCLMLKIRDNPRTEYHSKCEYLVCVNVVFFYLCKREGLSVNDS